MTPDETQDKGIIPNPQTGEVRIILNHPFEFAGKQISEMTLRRPKGRDLEAMEKEQGGESARAISLIALLNTDDDIHTPVMRELDAHDIGRATEVIAGFLNTPHQTGET